MRIIPVVILATGCATTPRTAGSIAPTAAAGGPAEADEPTSMPTPLDSLGADIADAFSGTSLLYFATAVGASGAMAWSPIDRDAHLRFDDRGERPWNTAAYIAGFAVPSVVPTTLWIGGLASRDRTVAGAGSAAIQAVVLTMATTGALKLATGRAYPPRDDEIEEHDSAHDLRPFRNGLGAWPSGHTAAMTSVAAALTAYYPDDWWIPALGYPMALGVGLGMLERDSHWASDLVAGALIGHAIGYSIGKSFRKRLRGERLAPNTIELVPFAGAPGVSVVGAF
jgi:membrane-associated phospholipid phosphatase